MTREEEIIEAGIDYTMSVRPMCLGGLAFEEDIRKMNRNKSFEEGAKWADKTMIDKAAKWIIENIDLYAYKLEKKDFPFDYPIVERIVLIDNFYDDFKVAMEE